MGLRNPRRGLRFIDALPGPALFLAGLAAYTATLAPTVLEGDAALFQYTPVVLGVTYPTGFPLYILLGKVWVTLFPFGEIAWRMNLLSAVCSAAALPLLYGAARRLYAHPAARWAALAAVLTFATAPTFWRWSTEAKTYTLTMLLFSLVLYLLALALARSGQVDPPPGTRFYNFVTGGAPLALPALLLGLQISVHNTAVLLGPGLALLAWLNFGPFLRGKKLWAALLLLAAPGLFYLYIPLRAEWLIAQYGREQAIAMGLLADFYHSGPAGLLRYFSATDFTGGVVTNWGLLPQQFAAVYVPLLLDEFSGWGAALGLLGGLGLLVSRPRLFWPLFLLYAVPIPFVLTYGQGEQSAFLIPSFLIVAIFAGYTPVLAHRAVTRLTTRNLRPFLPALAAPGLFAALIPLLLWPQTHYSLNRLDVKWNRAIYDEWADALAHPLPPGAAMLAHWGDLTSMWYMQHAEGRRPDVRGLYPPTEAVVSAYLAQNKALFIAGPLPGEVGDIEQRFTLIPWGRLVRLAPLSANPESLLPVMARPLAADFGQNLRLLGADFPAQAVGGTAFPVTLTWQALADLPPETTLSVRLARDTTLVAQLDDTLLSGWFPHPTLYSGQTGLSSMPVDIPLGTLPGRYRLQVAAYTHHKSPWPLADGAPVLDLGEVEMVLPPAGLKPANQPLLPAVFNGEIMLADSAYSVSRVGQGKGFALRLLWQAQTRPEDNYTLRVELADAAGRVLRQVDHQPVNGLAPTGGWQPGQYVRDQVDLVLPAGAPPGPDAIRVRLSWLRPNGSALAVRRWWLPLGQTVALPWLTVTQKEGRMFDLPPLAQVSMANLDNQVRLAGYNSPQRVGPGELAVNPAACAPACQLHLDVYWQGISEMGHLYTVFAHLVDGAGRIVAQHDRGPGVRAKQPTTAWLPGEVVQDPIDLPLPPELPPGRYTLRIGMYLSPGGPRLPVLDAAGQITGDFVELGAVEIAGER